MKAKDLYFYPGGIWDNLSEIDKWESVKLFQRGFLSASDWTQVTDVNLTIKQKLEWQTYRDALRSIQDDFANPDDVVFPVEPTEE